MSMRTFSLIALLLVAACGKPDNAELAKAEARAGALAEADGMLECAIGDGSEFTRACEEERISGPDGVTMIVKHPDGGFRRFAVLTDGRGLAASDGAEAAKISILDGRQILVTVGEDRYKFPARMKGSVVKLPAPPAPAAGQ